MARRFQREKEKVGEGDGGAAGTWEDKRQHVSVDDAIELQHDAKVLQRNGHAHGQHAYGHGRAVVLQVAVDRLLGDNERR